MTSVSYSRSTRKPQRIGFLGKGDRVFLAGRAVADHDLRQAVLAFQPDEMAGIGHVGEDQRARLVRHDVAPVLLARFVNRRFHDLEILGAVVIGEDVEDIAALGHRIFDAGLARRRPACGSAVRSVVESSRYSLVSWSWMSM